MTPLPSEPVQVIEVYGGDGVPPKEKRKRGVKKKVEKHTVLAVIDFKPDNVHFKNERALAERIVKVEEKIHDEVVSTEKRVTKVEKQWDKIFEELRGRFESFKMHFIQTSLVAWAALIAAIVALAKVFNT